MEAEKVTVKELNPLQYIIVIKDNPASEYYYNYVIESWKQENINLLRFDAVEPNTLSSFNHLRFGINKALKYSNLNIVKHFTETEKCVWYSHYFLWKKAAESNKPILVVEHDTMLVQEDTMIVNLQKQFITFDNSFGCYIMFPKLAKKIIQLLDHLVITYGPYGFVHEIGKKYFDITVCSDPEFRKGVIQVMSKKFGSTIDHYSNMEYNDFKKLSPQLINSYRFLRIP